MEVFGKQMRYGTREEFHQLLAKKMNATRKALEGATCHPQLFAQQRSSYDKSPASDER